MLLTIGRRLLLIIVTLVFVSVSITLWPVGDISPDRQLDIAGAKLSRGFDGLETLGVALEGPEYGDIHAEIAAKLPKVQRLSFAKSQVTDQGIAALRSIKGLKQLNLSRTRWTLGMVDAVSTLSSLRDLSLEGCDWVRDEHIDALATLPHLETLDLSGTQITPFAFETLAHFPVLKFLLLQNSPRMDDTVVDSLIELCQKHPMRLALGGTEISLAGLSRLRANLPDIRIDLRPEAMSGLRDVALRGTFLTNPKEEIYGFRRRRDIDGFTPELLSGDLAVVSSVPGIQFLNLDQSGITDELLLELKFMPQLDTLRLSSTQITDQGLQVLDRLPNLQTLTIMDADVSGRGLENLRHVPRLQRLHVQTFLGDEVLPDIAGLTDLKSLTIHAPLTDAGIERLVEMKSLKSLELIQTNVKGPGLEKLGLMSGLNELIIDGGSIDDNDIDAIGQLQNIRRVVLIQTKVTTNGKRRLSALAPHMDTAWPEPERNPVNVTRY